MLGTDAGVLLLREMTRHGCQLSAPDLVRRTGLAKASVAHGLRVLEAARIVDAAGTGRSILYRVRPEHPLAPALRALFETEEARFQAVLDSVRQAAQVAGNGVIAAWLFGSVARGEDRADSDLDVAIVADASDLTALADAIRDRLRVPAETLGFSPSVVALATGDVLRLAAERDPWWVSVSESALPLIGPRPNDLRAILARRVQKAAAA